LISKPKALIIIGKKYAKSTSVIVAVAQWRLRQGLVHIVRAARDWVVAGWFNQENTPDTVIEEKKALSAKLESLL
jgi:hypothetical protein